MDFTVIAHAVEVDHGIKRLSMRFIKKYAAPDRARLSADLCDQITQEFDKLGLITLPRHLPTSENDFVFVIEKQTPLGQAIEIASAVTRMDAVDMSPLPDLTSKYPDAREYLS